MGAEWFSPHKTVMAQFQEIVKLSTITKSRGQGAEASLDIVSPKAKPSLAPKRLSKEWIEYGKIAEWMAVKEGRTLEEIHSAPDITVSIQTLNLWSVQHKWQEKRQAYIRRPTTIATLVHDLLFGSLMKSHHRQVGGTDLPLDEIAGLEKLLKMYKLTGVPFHAQAALVMKEFVRFTTMQLKGMDELQNVLDVVEEFSRKVENGLIRPEAT
jgi:hypothetical protein